MHTKRRSLLVAMGGSLALAGCLGDDDDDDDADPPEADDDADDTDDAPADDEDEDDEIVDDEDEDDDEDDDDDTDDEIADDEDVVATVQVSSHDEHGHILVGPDGLSLYMFDSDEQGADQSTCYDDCAENWPPLIAEDEPEAGDGVDAELTTFDREDGEMQIAANGWPLYYWIGDEEPGDVNGQAVNDVWWLLTPDGEPIRDDEDDDGGGRGGY